MVRMVVCAAERFVHLASALLALSCGDTLFEPEVLALDRGSESGPMRGVCVVGERWARTRIRFEARDLSTGVTPARF
jgi:hypothetical protein